MAAVSPANRPIGGTAFHSMNNSLLGLDWLPLVILMLRVLVYLLDQRLSVETARVEALRQSEALPWPPYTSPCLPAAHATIILFGARVGLVKKSAIVTILPPVRQIHCSGTNNTILYSSAYHTTDASLSSAAKSTKYLKYWQRQTAHAIMLQLRKTIHQNCSCLLQLAGRQSREYCWENRLRRAMEERRGKLFSESDRRVETYTRISYC